MIGKLEQGVERNDALRVENAVDLLLHLGAHFVVAEGGASQDLDDPLLRQGGGAAVRRRSGKEHFDTVAAGIEEIAFVADRGERRR